MRNSNKRIVAFIMAIVMALPGLPMNVIESKAAPTSVTYNFGMPTAGVVLEGDTSRGNA